MPQQPANTDTTAALEEAIEKAREVAADIRKAADDLAVANTVLETHLEARHRSQEVDQALGHTDAVEKKLDKSAETLDEVNSVLENVAPSVPGASRA